MSLLGRCLASRLRAHRTFASAALSSLGDVILNSVPEASVKGLLGADGFAVIDGVFGAENSRALSKEVQALKSSGMMQRNCTHFVAGGRRTTIAKDGIWEVEAHNLSPEGAALAPSISAYSKDRTLLTLLNIYLGTGVPDALHYQALKIQANDGGGACFPLHFDSDEAVDSRRLTALFYLNPDWKRGDGGELVLYPSLMRKVVIEPRLDRLVLFSAHGMLHRVLPSAVERRCFTVWMFGRHAATAAGGPWSRRQSGGTPPAGSAPAAGAAATAAALEAGPLGAPKFRKHLFRAVLADEWAQSISESHEASPDRDKWLENHWAEVAQIEQALEKAVPGSLGRIEEVRAELLARSEQGQQQRHAGGAEGGDGRAVRL